MVSTTVLHSNCFNIDNKNYYFLITILVSKESWDTEGYTNGCWKLSSATTEKKLHFKIHYDRKQFFNYNNISQYYYFYCIFDQVNAAFVIIRSFFSKRNIKVTLIVE